MNRRGFLTGILALGSAPAIVRADSLMRVVPRDAAIVFTEAGLYRLTPYPSDGSDPVWRVGVDPAIGDDESIVIVHQGDQIVGAYRELEFSASARMQAFWDWHKHGFHVREI